MTSYNCTVCNCSAPESLNIEPQKTGLTIRPVGTQSAGTKEKPGVAEAEIEPVQLSEWCGLQHCRIGCLSACQTHIHVDKQRSLYHMFYKPYHGSEATYIKLL